MVLEAAMESRQSAQQLLLLRVAVWRTGTEKKEKWFPLTC